MKTDSEFLAVQNFGILMMKRETMRGPGLSGAWAQLRVSSGFPGGRTGRSRWHFATPPSPWGALCALFGNVSPPSALIYRFSEQREASETISWATGSQSFKKILAQSLRFDWFREAIGPGNV